MGGERRRAAFEHVFERDPQGIAEKGHHHVGLARRGAAQDVSFLAARRRHQLDLHIGAHLPVDGQQRRYLRPRHFGLIAGPLQQRSEEANTQVSGPFVEKFVEEQENRQSAASKSLN